MPLIHNPNGGCAFSGFDGMMPKIPVELTGLVLIIKDKYTGESKGSGFIA